MAKQGLAVLGLLLILVACASSVSSVPGKTCTAPEESACTSTYQLCIDNAAKTAKKADCEKCVDDYCGCYNKCGNTCDSAKLKGDCRGT